MIARMQHMTLGMKMHVMFHLLVAITIVVVSSYISAPAVARMELVPMAQIMVGFSAAVLIMPLVVLADLMGKAALVRVFRRR